MAGSADSRKTRCRVCPWLWGLGIVGAVAGAIWLVQKPSTTDGSFGPSGPSAFNRRGMPGMAVPVRVATAAPARIPYVISAIGTVTAFNTVTVRSRVDGELQEILFEDGQTVKSGTLLARIDPLPYQVQLDEALGKQAQNLAQLKNAQRDLQRYQQLVEQNSIARQVLDAQQAQVQQLQGLQKSDQAAVDRARLQLAYTQISAPISGRLGLRRVDPGNLVSAGNADGLVTIAQIEPIAVLFTIPQAQLPDVLAQADRTLTVEVYDRQDTRKLASGELMALDNAIDAATGTLRIKARFANTDQTLFPNQFVNVRLHVSSEDAPVTVPVAAAQFGSVGDFVYRVRDDGTAEMRRITFGRSDGERLVVLAGLDAGDRVVVEGADRLRDGIRVMIRDDTRDDARDETRNDAAPAEMRPRGGAGNNAGNSADSENAARPAGAPPRMRNRNP